MVCGSYSGYICLGPRSFAVHIILSDPGLGKRLSFAECYLLLYGRYSSDGRDTADRYHGRCHEKDTNDDRYYGKHLTLFVDFLRDDADDQKSQTAKESQSQDDYYEEQEEKKTRYESHGSDQPPMTALAIHLNTILIKGIRNTPRSSRIRMMIFAVDIGLLQLPFPL